MSGVLCMLLVCSSRMSCASHQPAEWRSNHRSWVSPAMRCWCWEVHPLMLRLMPALYVDSVPCACLPPPQELGITSDEALVLDNVPEGGTIVIVGAGYIAVEFAGATFSPVSPYKAGHVGVAQGCATARWAMG